MIEITIKEKKEQTFTLIINNKVLKAAYATRQFDALKEVQNDSNLEDLLDDHDLIAFIGHQAAMEGAKFSGQDFPYTEQQFSSLMDRVTAIQIGSELMRELIKGFEYITTHLPKKQMEGVGISNT